MEGTSTSKMEDIAATDVLVCGAGPVGLLIALGLEQQGVDTLLIGMH